jgi:hypothetical protein
VLAAAWLDAVGREQPLQLARTRAIESDLDAGRNHGGCRAGTHRELHVQQGVVAATRHSAAQVAVSGESCLLVEYDEFDVRYVPEQPVLERSQDPGDPRARPCVLQRSHDRKCMTDVTQRGQAQHADPVRGRREERWLHGDGR